MAYMNAMSTRGLSLDSLDARGGGGGGGRDGGSGGSGDGAAEVRALGMNGQCAT